MQQFVVVLFLFVCFYFIFKHKQSTVTIKQRFSPLRKTCKYILPNRVSVAFEEKVCCMLCVLTDTALPRFGMAAHVFRLVLVSRFTSAGDYASNTQALLTKPNKTKRQSSDSQLPEKTSTPANFTTSKRSGSVGNLARTQHAFLPDIGSRSPAV